MPDFSEFSRTSVSHHHENRDAQQATGDADSPCDENSHAVPIIERRLPQGRMVTRSPGRAASIWWTQPIQLPRSMAIKVHTNFRPW